MIPSDVVWRLIINVLILLFLIYMRTNNKYVHARSVSQTAFFTGMDR